MVLGGLEFTSAFRNVLDWLGHEVDRENYTNINEIFIAWLVSLSFQKQQIFICKHDNW